MKKRGKAGMSENSLKSHRRNGFLGQLCLSRTNVEHMVGSGLLSEQDVRSLLVALDCLATVLGRWDRHYITNMKEQG